MKLARTLLMLIALVSAPTVHAQTPPTEREVYKTAAEEASRGCQFEEAGLSGLQTCGQLTPNDCMVYLEATEKCPLTCKDRKQTAAKPTKKTKEEGFDHIPYMHLPGKPAVARLYASDYDSALVTLHTHDPYWILAYPEKKNQDARDTWMQFIGLDNKLYWATAHAHAGRKDTGGTPTRLWFEVRGPGKTGDEKPDNLPVAEENAETLSFFDPSTGKKWQVRPLKPLKLESKYPLVFELKML